MSSPYRGKKRPREDSRQVASGYYNVYQGQQQNNGYSQYSQYVAPEYNAHYAQFYNQEYAQQPYNQEYAQQYSQYYSPNSSAHQTPYIQSQYGEATISSRNSKPASITAMLLGQQPRYSEGSVPTGAPAYTNDGYAMSSTVNAKELEQYAEEERQALAHYSQSEELTYAQKLGQKSETNRFINGIKIPGYNKSLDTPEDIAKWRAERKANYPTAANIAKKETERQERIARGEFIPGNGKRGRGDKGGRGRGRGQRGNDSNRHKLSETSSRTSASEQHIQATERNGLENDDDVPQVFNSRSEVKAPGPAPHAGASSNQICKYYLQNRCRKGSSCQFRHERPERQSKSAKADNEFSTRPSLLRSLLNKEILSEQSILLQSIRFIVGNDFFRGHKLLGEEEDIKLIDEIRHDPVGIDEEERSVDLLGSQANEDACIAEIVPQDQSINAQ